MTYIMSLYFQFQFFGLYNLGWGVLCTLQKTFQAIANPFALNTLLSSQMQNFSTIA